MGKSPAPSPTPGGTPKPLLAPSPGLVQLGSGGGNGAVEFERLKAMYDGALLQQQQQQQQGRWRSMSTGGGGGLDYLYRASELDGTVVQRGGGMAPGGVYEVSGQGRGGQ